MTRNNYKKIVMYLFVFWSFLVIDAFSSAIASEPHDYFVFGIGLISSSEQHDIMKQTYSDYSTSGGGSMINIELGYSITVNDHFSIEPKLNLIGYRAKFENSNFTSAVGSTKANIFFMPGLSFRYHVSSTSNGFIVSGCVAKNNASSDFSRVKQLEDKGVSSSVSIGYIFGSYELDIGVMKVPVTIETDTITSRDADFGGTFFTFKWLI